MGLPDHSEALEANLEYQLHASHGDLRGFLATAAEARDLGEFSDVLGAALLPVGVHACVSAANMPRAYCDTMHLQPNTCNIGFLEVCSPWRWHTNRASH